ncbi:hypothetical protein GCM10011325_44570 [Dyadobacter sediminis]|nr:hypothetical protein GCM10011325_44570 [Dyadobacter sediminis]
MLININKTSKAFIGWSYYQVSNKEILDFLIAYGKPSDRMAVWGWGSQYIHEARLLMGTRDVHFDFQTSYLGPIGDYYKDRFLIDLKQNRPKWLLDISSTKEFGGSEKSRLENFYPIHAFVCKNYEIVYSNSTATLYRYRLKEIPN